MFQIVFEATLFLLVLLFGIFQIVVPLAQNRKVFPMFRKELSEAEKELTDTVQQVAVQEVVAEKKELQKKLRKQK